MKMKVEIWSDIMCPFCYIGKRHFEKAMSQFPEGENIEVVWKSFQLDPMLPVAAENKQDVYEYLSERKGITKDHVLKLHANVTNMAAAAGLEYHLEKTVMVNSFRAHRVLQLAKERGLSDQAEESLFFRNFTQGQDFGDTKVLVELGKEIGLTEADVDLALTDEKYAAKVREDIQEASEIGVQGVPFFVFNRKFAVSGAQPPQNILSVLEKSFGEWRKDHPAAALEVSEGLSCSPEGCD